MNEIDDATLMAFADGVLDEPGFSKVARAVEQDPQMAERLDLIIQGRELARAAYAPLLQPVSPELERQVRATIARSEQPQVLQTVATWLRQHWPSMVIAAAVTAVIAGPAGYLARGDAAPDGLAIYEALDTVPSGQTVQVANRDIGLIATFENGDGVLCREYETLDEAAASVSIACRFEGTWQTQLTVASATTGSDYTPTSGLSVVDAFLDEIGAGPVLLDAEERAALGVNR